MTSVPTLRNGAWRQLPGRLPRYVEVQKEIGAGTFGAVFRVRDRRPGKGELLAMKCLLWERLWVGADSSVKQLEGYTAWESRVDELNRDLQAEAQILSRFRHQYIVDYKGMLLPSIKVGPSLADGDPFQQCAFPALLTSLCDGTLYDLYSKDGDYADKSYVWTMFRQMISALTYIHDSGFIHLDIKPKNILFCANNLERAHRPQSSRRRRTGARYIFKLADFGMCRSVVDAAGQNCGTRTYMAPEHRRKDPVPQSDIYSLYVTMLMAMNIDNISFRISDQPYDEIRDMVRAAMKKATKLKAWEYMGRSDYRLRKTARDVMNQIWMYVDFDVEVC